jgi:hypothetical protein
MSGGDLLGKWFLTRDDFTPEGTSSNVWRHFHLFQWRGAEGRACYQHWQDETRDVAKYPTVHRTGPYKELYHPKCQQCLG